MFDIGFWEIALIAMLALVVLGPKRLPDAARAAGYWIGRARQFIATAKHDLDQELQGGGLEEIRRLKEELDETRRYIHQVAGKAETDLTEAIDDIESTSTKEFGKNKIGRGSRAAQITASKAKKKTAGKKTAGKKTSGKKSPKKKSQKKKAGSSTSSKRSRKKSAKKKSSSSLRKKAQRKKSQRKKTSRKKSG